MKRKIFRLKNVGSAIKNINKKNINSDLIVGKITTKKAAGWPLVIGYLSVFLIISGILCLFPLVCLPFYTHEVNRILAFLIPGLSAIILGIPGTFLLKKGRISSLGKHYDYVLLIVIWIFTILVNCIPYLMPTKLGGLGLSFTEAMFETVSGLTTTGFTILTRHSEISPSVLLNGDGHVFLFHRALLCFFGGIGFALVLASAISNKFGMRLYYSEGHNERFLPSLAKSARLVFTMYTGIVIVGALLLYLCGMNEWSYSKVELDKINEAVPTFFDALTLSMTSLSAAGFTVRDTSVMFYNSIGVEIITMILMMIANTNLLIVYYIIRLRWKHAATDCETKFTLIYTLIFVPIIFLSMMYSPSLPDLVNGGAGIKEFEPLDAFRQSMFYYVSASSCTGFDSMSNIGSQMSSLTMMIFIILMTVGGGAGSTSAGIKKYRIIIALKGTYWSIRDNIFNKDNHIVYPRNINRFGEKKFVSDSEYRDCITYILLYLGLLLVFSIIISFLTPPEFSYMASLFEASSALAGVGLSSGIVQIASYPILWMLQILMFIGRLEIYAIIYGFYRVGKDIFVRKKKQTFE